MTEVNGVGRRKTQFLDDLRNRKRHWKLKIEKGGNYSLSHKKKKIKNMKNRWDDVSKWFYNDYILQNLSE